MSSNVAFFPSNRPKESFKVLDRHTQNADFGLKEEGGIDGNRRRMWDLSPLMALLPNKAKSVFKYYLHYCKLYADEEVKCFVVFYQI
jgi:hypothetical protein